MPDESKQPKPNMEICEYEDGWSRTEQAVRGYAGPTVIDDYGLGKAARCSPQKISKHRAGRVPQPARPPRCAQYRTRERDRSLAHDHGKQGLASHRGPPEAFI